jgi:hypothetical protein
MAKSFDQIRREMAQAARRAQQEQQRRINEYNRQARQHNEQVRREEAKRIAAVNDYNRKVRQQNEQLRRAEGKWIQEINARNRRVVDYNRRLARAVDQHNADVARYNRQLEYTPREQVLVDRVSDAVALLADARETDVFISYARIDGSDTATALHAALESLGVRVWLDVVEIQPGKSQGRQMDRALAKAKSGVAVLTPAYITGRFWTERELGALLSKSTLIPVLHKVTFDEVSEYSGILPDLAGFETVRDSVDDIALKIAAAVLSPEPN